MIISANSSVHLKYASDAYSISSIDKNKTPLSGVKTDDLMISRLNQANVSSPTNSDRNEILIAAGDVYSFGSINGKPLHISLSSNGSIETNFSPMIRQSLPGSAVTPYQMEAANQFSSYTDDEHRKENQLIGRLDDLLDVSKGKMTLDEYNARESSPYVSSTQQLLQQLGIDSGRPFSINGTKLKFEDGHISKI